MVLFLHFCLGDDWNIWSKQVIQYTENLYSIVVATLSVNNVLGVLTAMLHFQLKEIPEDFFVDIVSKNNFLTVVLQVWCMISVYMLHCLNRPLFLPCQARMGIRFGFQSLRFYWNSNSGNSSKIQFLVKTDWPRHAVQSYVILRMYDSFITSKFPLYPQTFFSNLEESTTADKALVKRGLQFRENLTKKYKWDFSSEPEDYAPTIVETWQSLIMLYCLQWILILCNFRQPLY